MDINEFIVKGIFGVVVFVLTLGFIGRIYRAIKFVIGFFRPKSAAQNVAGLQAGFNNFRSNLNAAVPTSTISPRNEQSTDSGSLKPAHARYSFGQVQGMTELKRDLVDAMLRIRSEGKNGILLSGDPGNGKTYIAEALAGEFGLPFLSINVGDVASRWVGQGVEQIKAVFNAARAHAPCMLFIDEIDSLITSRDSINSEGSSAGMNSLREANTMLTGLNDLRGSGVVIVGATNFKDKLDSAAIREGRFDFKIEVAAPDAKAREFLLVNTLAFKNAELFPPIQELSWMDKLMGKAKGEQPDPFVYEESCVEKIARRWEGFSVVRIRSAVENAVHAAYASNTKLIRFDDMMAAMRQSQGGKGKALGESALVLSQMSFQDDLRIGLNELANRMKNISVIEEMGGTVPKGILFYGPPGTGKTAAAQALAKTAGWAYLETSGHALLSSPDDVDGIITKARDLRPCVVFIDEADDILMDRAANPYGKAATNKLLAALDGSTQLHDVMFVAATNYPDTLDAAAIRGGRLSEHFEFGLPDADICMRLVKNWMSEKPKTPFTHDFTPTAAAELLEGLAPADIRDRLQKAVNRGVGKVQPRVTLEDLQAVVFN
jgi:transitional endoplasmic reticulum ATPase